VLAAITETVGNRTRFLAAILSSVHFETTHEIQSKEGAILKTIYLVGNMGVVKIP
jgi:hypothetical protein